jgi:hypothetical protein
LIDEEGKREVTEAERQDALRWLFELCLWPIDYGAEYDEEIIHTLTPIEMEVLTEELNKYSERPAK